MSLTRHRSCSTIYENMNTEEKFQCGVGRLIFVFGDFEEILTRYLCKLINHDECVGRAVTDDLMITPKMKLLRKLAPYFYHQPDHELFDILKDFEDLKNKRVLRRFLWRIRV